MNAVKGVNQRRSAQLNELLSNSKNKSIFVGAITTLLFLFLMIFGVVPSFRAVLAQNRENQQIAEVIEDVEDKIQVMENLVAESEEKAEVIDTFNSVFANDIDQGNFIEELYNLAGEEVSINNISFPSTFPVTLSLISSNSEVRQVQVSLSATGTKRSLVEFYKKLEESRRIINVERINLTRRAESIIQEVGFDQEYEVSLIFNYYYWNNNIELEDE